MDAEILIPAGLFLLTLLGKKGQKLIQVEVIDPTGKRIQLTVDANNPPIGWNGINVIPMDQLALRGPDGGPKIPQNVVAAARTTAMTDAQRMTAYNVGPSLVPDLKSDPTGYVNYACKTDPAAFNLQLGFKCINGLPVKIIVTQSLADGFAFAFNPDARLTDAEIAKYNAYNSHQPKLTRDTMLVMTSTSIRSAPRLGF